MKRINIVFVILASLLFSFAGCISLGEIREELRPLVRLNPHTGAYEPIKRVPSFNYEENGWMTIVPWKDSDDPYNFCGRCHRTGRLQCLDSYRRAARWRDAAEIKRIIIKEMRGNKPCQKAVSGHDSRVMQPIPNITPP